MAITAEEIIKMLVLAPHPEGSYFHEAWREECVTSERAVGTANYYLLCYGER